MRAIARTSERNWGRPQAERYVAKLDEAFFRLAAYPDIGHEAPDLGRDVRVLVVEQHRVVYRHSSRGVSVLRVLHQQMDLYGAKLR